MNIKIDDPETPQELVDNLANTTKWYKEFIDLINKHRKPFVCKNAFWEHQYERAMEVYFKRYKNCQIIYKNN